jgi:signal transduction histidine kinase
MRLTIKITFAVLFGVALIFSVHSYDSIQRERAQLKKNLSRESRHIGESLRVIVTELWQQKGEEAAIGFLARANKGYAQATVRWVWIEEEVDVKFRPRVPLSQLEALHDEVHVTLLAGTEDGRDFLLTYIPLLVDGKRLGAIELSESMDEMHEYAQESLRRSAMIIAACVVSGLLLMAVMGSIWVGRPMRKLRAQAERIGTGDFTTSGELGGSGELAELSATIERMRGQLEKSRQAEQAANEEKIAALEKLRHTERLATLGQLSAGMAHELGTPLNVISGRAKLIGRGDLPTDDVSRSARIIGEQAERMITIMRQLLSFARRSESRKQLVDLGALLRVIEPLIAPTAHSQKVELAIGENGETFKVEADSGQLQQVLLNLCLNGIQAMPEGGLLELECLCEQATPPETLNTDRRDWACVRICDQGTGMDKETLAQIFDPFFTTKDVGQGTGLGLSIAYGIVEEHGGWIRVDSSLGQGSCFNVYLPLGSAGEES